MMIAEAFRTKWRTESASMERRGGLVSGPALIAEMLADVEALEHRRDDALVSLATAAPISGDAVDDPARPTRDRRGTRPADRARPAARATPSEERPPLWTQREAAAYLRVTPRYLRDSSCPKILLPGSGLHGRALVRYSPEDVMTWHSTRRVSNAISA